MGSGAVSPCPRVRPAMSLFPLFALGVTAAMRFVSFKSPTLVQQLKVSYTANGVGAEVLDHMGHSAGEPVSRDVSVGRG